MNIFERAIHEVNRKSILKVLPGPENKTQKGKTRKQIARLVYLKAEKVGRYLQTLKRQHKVRCYQGKWRRTKLIV